MPRGVFLLSAAVLVGPARAAAEDAGPAHAKTSTVPPAATPAELERQDLLHGELRTREPVDPARLGMAFAAAARPTVMGNLCGRRARCSRSRRI